ncbi:MAG: polysaccharide biosynthesis C-terminal domain-containing protein [Chitinophagales bacterium]|nr:polysaccharide biosynthesis C-terminal domain-containing protein [Chitinophagales bacterium]
MLAFIGIVLNVILNFILIPKQGACGAALATWFTQGLIGVGQLFIVYVHWKIKMSKQDVLKILLYVLIAVVFAYLVHTIKLPWLIQSIIYLVGMGILSLFLRLVSLKPLLHESRI